MISRTAMALMLAALIPAAQDIRRLHTTQLQHEKPVYLARGDANVSCNQKRREESLCHTT
jgi:hypothetical protein